MHDREMARHASILKPLETDHGACNPTITATVQGPAASSE
jgi:hypothetical protein